jgi:signal transduction histidine kinase
MRHWFASLPIHRKLITMALAVSACALLAATVGLLAFDIARFRTQAVEDARALAQVIAENSAAAIEFDDADAARMTLSSVRVRPVVSRACVYRKNGSLLAEYRGQGGQPCPQTPLGAVAWDAVSTVVPVRWNGRMVGSVYVERALADLGRRVAVTASAGGLVLLLAGLLALGLARRLQRVISRPIVELADAARAIERGDRHEMPAISAPPDETGDLARAFGDMVRRLLSSNEALRAEVDERRRMEAERERLLVREREASRLKDEFLAAVSHELRTPLNAILGWTHILSQTNSSDPIVQKASSALERNAHAQNRVIEDLLDISRIITGKLPLSLTASDLRSIVDSAVEVVAPSATVKGITVKVETPGSPSIVHGDHDRLRQVVWNLLSNAVKFTPAKGTVTVRLVRIEGAYSIVVSDTGIGISPQFLDHVFERFRQADGSTTRLHGGLGLGLAIVKELTELHGGHVQAYSAGLNQGAMFTVTLPALDGALRDVSAAGAALSPSPRLDGLTVLAVDDNQDSLDILAATLADAGATVRVAKSGADAVEDLQHLPVDIVICDLAMPGMDGFEVLMRVREMDEATHRVTPVLALSAYASQDYRQRCLEAGFRGHIAKPIAPPDLIRAVAATGRG